MKIYHYTKGLHLKSIFKDGFIATEQKRNLNTTAPFFTDVVWLTESQTVPVTALPFIPFIPSTDLSTRQKIKNVNTDYASIAPLIGGFWRFGFDSNDHGLEKWFFSKARSEAYKRPEVDGLDRIANRVGDNIRSFWISERDIPLKNFTVEYLLTDTNEWVECEPSSIVFRDIPNGRGYAICISPYLEAA